MNTATSQRYVTYPQASAYSGLSERSLRRLAARGELAVYRPVPGRVVLDLRQLDAFIRSTGNRCIRRSRGWRLHAGPDETPVE